VVKFDRQLLKDRLEGVIPLCRMLFAVAGSERLYPSYKLFFEKSGWGSADYLRATLDHLWELALQGQIGYEEPFLSDYESLFPGEGAEWSPLNPLAENAVVALTYACQCQQKGDAESAAWAAVQGYEAVDYIAHTLGKIDFKGPEAEAAILKTECVQAEIERQLRDIAELEKVAHDGSGIDRVVEIFRKRAMSEGLTLVPLVSALCK
jgi:uncharacterized protein YjaG (DUF416 family)